MKKKKIENKNENIKLKDKKLKKFNKVVCILYCILYVLCTVIAMVFNKYTKVLCYLSSLFGIFLYIQYRVVYCIGCMDMNNSKLYNTKNR